MTSTDSVLLIAIDQLDSGGKCMPVHISASIGQLDEYILTMIGHAFGLA